MSLPSREEARLCASVVNEIAHARGITGDALSVGALTTTVARLFNKGVLDRDTLLAEAMRKEIPSIQGDRSTDLTEPRKMYPGAIHLSTEPEDEKGNQHH
ncbi:MULTISPECIES: hypothetical protein [unclassified Rhizobium]|uniref:hypothetical protein n=1 Tax=unclassified Rhizobium TaxID=2613769 RepID=UPI000BEA16E6|nr:MULTISPECIES: hypothetical protein [unclassified Rhizobium]MDF0664016.1 hypothetical protein [Rhizobium sp. BC49]PDS78981.1 hypothetical protein CO654_32270 [Rhizobium sp. L18]